MTRIRAKGGCAVLAGLKARSGPDDLEIDDTIVVDGRSDVVFSPVLGQRHGDVIGVEGDARLIKAVVVQGVGRPEGRTIAIGVEDLGVELTGRPNASRPTMGD